WCPCSMLRARDAICSFSALGRLHTASLGAAETLSARGAIRTWGIPSDSPARRLALRAAAQSIHQVHHLRRLFAPRLLDPLAALLLLQRPSSASSYRSSNSSGWKCPALREIRAQAL